MQTNVYSGDDFPEMEFRSEAIAWFNKKKSGLFGSSMSVGTYCFNRSKQYRPGYEPSFNAGYGFAAVDGPCHATFSNASDETTTFIVSLLVNNTHVKLMRPFLEYLLSPTESPWRSVLQDLHVIRDKSVDHYPVGFIFPNLNQHHIHVVTNFIIASRLNCAWGTGFLWGHFLKQGFSKDEALVLAPLFQLTCNQLRDVNYTDIDFLSCVPKDNNRPCYYGNYYSKGYRGYVSGDMPFGSYADPWKIINAAPEPKSEKTTWATGGAPNPCNYIWDKTPKPDLPTFIIYSDILDIMEGKELKPLSSKKVDELKKLLNTKDAGRITI